MSETERISMDKLDDYEPKKADKIRDRVAMLPEKLDHFLFRGKTNESSSTVIRGKLVDTSGQVYLHRKVEADGFKVFAAKVFAPEAERGAGHYTVTIVAPGVNIMDNRSVKRLKYRPALARSTDITFSVDEQGQVIVDSTRIETDRESNVRLGRDDRKYGSKPATIPLLDKQSLGDGEEALPYMSDLYDLFSDLVKRDNKKQLGGKSLRHLIVGRRK